MSKRDTGRNSDFTNNVVPMVNSAQRVAMYENLIRGLYKCFLGRHPDASGMKFWLSKLKAGDTIDMLVREVLQSEEYQARVEQASLRYNQNASMDEYCEAFSQWAREEMASSPLHIVDVSMQNLAYEDHFYKPLRTRKIPYHVSGFEPIEHGRLKNVDEHFTLRQDFICDGDKQQFYLNEPANTSSLLPLNREVLDRFSELNQISTLRVDTVRTEMLDNFVQDMKDVDLLKLDIQGLGLPSLKNAKDILTRTQVIHCSISFVEMYSGQALFGDVEQFLKTQGFDLVDIVNQKRYSFDGVSFSWSKDMLGQANAVFFRKLDSSAGVRRLLSQALIALIVYRKPSLAMWLADQVGVAQNPFTNLFNSETFK